jgi:mannose-1-phosphate guanylyltransferase
MVKLSQRIRNCDNGLAELSAKAPSNRIALLLAGGDGTRLQEFTREIVGTPIPKQYCRLLRGSSLLEATLLRARLFAPREQISVVINQDHVELATSQLSSIPSSNIFVQPMNRDTGPGMVFALLNLERSDPDAIVAAFPTDHFIDDDKAFIAHVFRAVHTISSMPDKIAILGITPDSPETGYGYILPANRLGPLQKSYQVGAFMEKPSISIAQNIISRGGLWNSFVMVFRISRMLELVNELMPNEFKKLLLLREEPHKAAELYQTMDSWNFSSQVLSRIPEHLIMHEVADVHWSDWGTRESIEKTYKALNIVPFWNLPSSITNPMPG